MFVFKALHVTLNSYYVITKYSVQTKKDFVKSISKPVKKIFFNLYKFNQKNHPIIKIEEDNFHANCTDENKYNKRNTSERNLKSANNNNKNNFYYTGLVYNNQTILASAINSSSQTVNSTQNINQIVN